MGDGGAPKEKKAMGCKWVYTVKFKADGTIEQYKERLVAKGLWGKLPGDLCTDGKSKHGKTPIISSSSFMLGNSIV